MTVASDGIVDVPTADAKLPISATLIVADWASARTRNIGAPNILELAAKLTRHDNTSGRAIHNTGSPVSETGDPAHYW